MPDLDHGLALELGGWDPRYSVVLATAARGTVAAALVDTNGDGADIDLDQYERGPDGLWVAGTSGNCGDAGAFSTGLMGVAWGCSGPGSTVGIAFAGTEHTVRASDDGWWMFVAPDRSGDVPRVITQLS